MNPGRYRATDFNMFRAGKISENGHYLYAYVFWGSTENSPVFTYYGDLKALNYQIRGPIRMQQMREKSDGAEISESLRGITGEVNDFYSIYLLKF